MDSLLVHAPSSTFFPWTHLLPEGWSYKQSGACAVTGRPNFILQPPPSNDPALYAALSTLGVKR